MMLVSDYIVDVLIRNGVTDTFGLPGSVILDFLYAMDRRKDMLTPHLCYHEQGAVFAACGYAQASGRIGVAYVMRGPGVTNAVTAIADAYYDSLPVLLITAHAHINRLNGLRNERNQEMDPSIVLSGISKYIKRIDKAEDVQQELENALHIALDGRKGPVILDFYTEIFSQEMCILERKENRYERDEKNAEEIAKKIFNQLEHAKRPAFLIGCGVRQSDAAILMRHVAERFRIPVLSSRAALDIMPESPMYFGFIGSHASRYSNFIFEKSDFLIAIGNRMSFPLHSVSFHTVMEEKATLWIDIDSSEFLREIPNCSCICGDIRKVLPQLMKYESVVYRDEWLSVCAELKQKLWKWDQNESVIILEEIFKVAKKDMVITCDVGNHEMWVSHAYHNVGNTNRLLFSNSFSVLGSSLAKAIGVFYATRSSVICVIGDQGIQLNLQELQTIASNGLPLLIVVVNNASSGMILSNEKKRYTTHFVHTTSDSGYHALNLESIANAYGIEYHRMEFKGKNVGFKMPDSLPCLLEIKIDERIGVIPTLPIGNPCQDLDPPLSREMYDQLDKL